ncbi:MAG: winged helix-turn-helix domain-containing protein [Planctomycetales bacterium]|nr:winged helix-turn-helix domain-containing protein [Planctomycetales bacterium]
MATKKTTTKKTTTAKTAAGAKAATKKATPRKKAAPKTKAANNAETKDKKLSAIDAAAKVLTDTKQAMNAKELVEAMAAKKLWTSPGGKTPHATLYSAILREINTKGKDSRFKKTERGKFAAKS